MTTVLYRFSQLSSCTDVGTALYSTVPVLYRYVVFLSTVLYQMALSFDRKLKRKTKF